MTVLVGKNGVGKSNILKAINWVARNATGPSIISLPPYEPRVGSVTLRCQLDGKLFDYTFVVTGPLAGRDRAEASKSPPMWGIAEALHEVHGDTRALVFSRDGNAVDLNGPQRVSLPPELPCLPFLLAVLHTSHPLTPTIKSLVEFLHGIHYYPFDEANEASQYSAVLPDEAYRAWLSVRTTQTGATANEPINKLVQMWLERKEVFQELRDLLGSKGLELIDDIIVKDVDVPGNRPGDPARKWYILNFRTCASAGGSSRPMDYEDLSQGTRRVVQILVSLLMDASSVMLIEHPEDTIHSGLTRKLIALLERYGDKGQLILATHSLVILNMVRPQDVRLVTIQGGQTRLRALNPQELSAAEKFIRDEGTLSDVVESLQD